MPARHLDLAAALFIGNVLWSGGLLRFLGEVAVRIQQALLPQGMDARTWVVLAVGGAIIVVSQAVMAPWYLRFYRQHRADVALSYGVPVPPNPRNPVVVRQRNSLIAAVAIGAILLAAVLPGIVGSAAAIVVGLGLRVGAGMVAASRDIQRR